MHFTGGTSIRDYINEKKNEILLGRLTTNDFQDFFRENSQPIQSLFTYSECAMLEVETKFRVLNEEFTLVYDHSPIETIKTRLKTLESLIEKLNRYQVPLTLDSIRENINDIAGVRVICSFPDDIYSLAECFLEQDDITLIEKRDMKVEVQFRTIAMDFWASLEHKIRYKQDLPEEVAAELYDELLECAQISADLDMRMQSIRKRLDDRIIP